LHTTQEVEESAERKKKRKAEAANIDRMYQNGPFNKVVFGAEAEYRSHKKRIAKVDHQREEYEKQKAQLGEDFYNANALNYGNEDIQPTGEQLLALKEHVEDLQNRRKEFSRRRRWDDNATIDFINERNRNFNAKASRAYDQYTEEIRENLERGTAI
jgi:pre-mRNA-splicing factor SYF2